MRSRLVGLVPDWLPAEVLVPSPSMIWAAAILVALFAMLRFARRSGLDERIMFWTALAGIVGTFLGGYAWAITGMLGPGNPDAPDRGMGVLGALAGAAACAWLYLRWRRLPVLPYADAATPAVILGYAIARVGCFLNGCGFGTPSTLPWAVRFPTGTEAFYVHAVEGWVSPTDPLSLAVHPTQLYHVGAALALFWLVRHVSGPTGARVAAAAAGYGIARFLLEFVRGDAIITPLGPSLGQIGALALIPIAFGLWLLKIGPMRAAAARAAPGARP